MRKPTIFLALCVLGIAALAVPKRVVVDKATKQVKRWGRCDFANDGSFDADAEEVMVADVCFSNDCRTWKYDTDAQAFVQLSGAEAVALWNASKSNVVIGTQQAIILMENRFMQVFDEAVQALKDEGIIPRAANPTPATANKEAFGVYLVQMTNQAAASAFSSRLNNTLDYLEYVTEKEIGLPPDGSSILNNIKQH